MKSLSETFFGRALGLLARVVMRHRGWFLWPQILLCGLCIIYTVKFLEFDPSQDNLVGSGKKYHQNYLQFKKEFPAQDDIVVVVESENAEKNRQFVERMGAKLLAEPKLFTNVFFRNDFKMLGKKALQFAKESDLESVKGKLTDYLPFIQKFTQATNLISMFDMVNSQFYHAKQEKNAENDALIKAVPMLKAIVDQATGSLQRQGTPPSPGITALFGAGDEDIYITYAKGQMYLVTAQARTADLNDDAVERIRQVAAELQREVPGLNIGITGESVLDHDQMEQSKIDTTVASIVSLALSAMIFIYGYQQTGRPLKATFCLIIGLGYTMAFTTLTVGHLNILTVTFLPILIGLAIDFGVHLITRYEEELRLGKTEEEAMMKAIVFTGQGVFTGALTTAAAFLAMAFTDFRGIQEMGVICGGGMIVCLIPMLTMLPVMLFRGRQNVIDHELSSRPDIRSQIENVWLHRPKTVLVITVVLSALAITQFKRIYFDYDLLNLQANGLPAVEFAKKLAHSGGKSVIFGVVVANTAEEAVEMEKKIRQLPTVMTVDSMAPYLVGDRSKKLELVREIKKEIAGIHFAPPDTHPVSLPRLSASLYSTYGYMGAAGAEVVKEESPTLTTNDIADLDSLASKLEDPATNDLVSQAISQQLSTETRAMLKTQAAAPNPRLPAALVDELNRLINGEALYKPQSAETPTLPTGLTNTNQAMKNRIFLADTYPLELPMLSKQLLAMHTAIRDLRTQMFAVPPAVAERQLAAFQQALFSDVTETFQAFQEQDDSSPMKVEDLPPGLQHRFISKATGKYLLQVYPKGDVWQRDKQETFVKELQTVDPKVTGTPVQLYYYTELLKDSYQEAARYSLIAIIIMVLLHFRTISSVILALLPVAIGSVWLGGWMGWFKIPFNPANIMTLPLVIGIGVTNGIHILNRFAEEKNPGILGKSTGKAVFVSGLTTISGFGSLILGRHQGIRSLGEVMSLGVAMCMIAGLTFLPALLQLLAGRRDTTKKQPSGDNARSTLGREEPR